MHHFVQLLHCELFDLVFSSESPANIIRYSQTCRDAKDAADKYLKRTFDIDKKLCSFFQHPTGFRALQRRTGMLISGSFALQFFDRTTYPNSDLDLYVDARFAAEVVDWLLEEEYTFQSNRRHPTLEDALLSITKGVGEPLSDTAILSHQQGDAYGPPGVITVITFNKIDSDSSVKIVQVMAALRTPIEVILRFHSSAYPCSPPPSLGAPNYLTAVVMNFISYKNAYSIYPHETFEKRRSLACGNMDAYTRRAREKYVRRGWTIVPPPAAPATSFRSGSRYIGDKDTWTLALSTLPDHQENTNHGDYFAIHSWDLDSHPRAMDDGASRVKFKILTSPLLRFSYTLAPTLSDIIPALVRKEFLSTDRFE